MGSSVLGTSVCIGLLSVASPNIKVQVHWYTWQFFIFYIIFHGKMHTIEDLNIAPYPSTHFMSGVEVPINPKVIGNY